MFFCCVEVFKWPRDPVIKKNQTKIAIFTPRPCPNTVVTAIDDSVEVKANALNRDSHENDAIGAIHIIVRCC